MRYVFIFICKHTPERGSAGCGSIVALSPMESSCAGKQLWLSDPCATLASSAFTHRTIPYVQDVRKTYTSRATLIPDTGATMSNDPSLNPNYANRSRLASRSGFIGTLIQSTAEPDSDMSLSLLVSTKPSESSTSMTVRAESRQPLSIPPRYCHSPSLVP